MHVSIEGLEPRLAGADMTYTYPRTLPKRQPGSRKSKIEAALRAEIDDLRSTAESLGLIGDDPEDYIRGRLKDSVETRQTRARSTLSDVYRDRLLAEPMTRPAAGADTRSPAGRRQTRSGGCESTLDSCR